MFNPLIADASGAIHKRKEDKLVSNWHSQNVPANVVLQRRLRQIRSSAAAYVPGCYHGANVLV